MDRRERIDDPLASMLAVLEGWQRGIWTAMPGIVETFDAAKQVCSVQPSIQAQVRGPDGVVTWTTMPLLLDCPVQFPRAGGYALTFPVQQGDEVLVVFASRCIDSWWDQGGVAQQAEYRLHDLSDGFAIPGVTSRPRALTGLSASAVQLRNTAGDVYVEIDGSSINVVTTGDVGVTAGGDITAEASGAATVTAPTITLNGSVTINGSTSFNGPISQVPGTQAGGGTAQFDGPVAVTNDVTAAGKSVSAHHHNEHDGPATSGPV